MRISFPRGGRTFTYRGCRMEVLDVFLIPRPGARFDYFSPLPVHAAQLRAQRPRHELPRRRARRGRCHAPRQPDVELLLAQPRTGPPRQLSLHRAGSHRHGELRETDRWLKLIVRAKLAPTNAELPTLLSETDQLIRIFVKSIATAEKRRSSQ